ncbi:hypothetical protein [Hahella sp. HN01]|uniref:hypothetical protein n=1 Tax=Hahella sp. HN01 TaxID=2847262 RepID=UPI001C1F19D1|nr:hypothetical protein [Hahella sp. HN01]MBU6955025.1 hypothetical protein [Hahella sp. HN01]
MSNQYEVVTIENDVLIVGVEGCDDGYILWQRGLTEDTGSEDGIYFEFDDQINGDFNCIKKCVVGNDGIRVAMTDGKSMHFYFKEGFNRFEELKSGLLQIYQGSEDILEFHF